MRAYARWAPVYDLVFGAVFEHGRRAAIGAAERIGGRILGGRRRHRHLAARVQRPQPPVRRRHLGADAAQGGGARRHALGLQQRRGTGGDGRREAVVPGRFVRCGGRTVRRHHGPAPGGDARRICPRARSPAARSCWSAASAPKPDCGGRWNSGSRRQRPRLGWRTEFPWERYSRWVAGHGNMRLIERRPMPPLGHFSLIRFAKIADDAAREERVRGARRRLTLGGTYRHASQAAADSCVALRRVCAFQHSNRNKDEIDGWISGGPANPAMGRPSLLSPQPRQSGAAPGQRGELPHRLRADLLGSGGGGADRLAGGDDQPADRALLLRAERLSTW